MLLPRLLGLLRQLFVTATFALPERKDGIRIGLAFIDRAARWNDLAGTHWANTAARRAPLDIYLKLFRDVSHL